MGFLAVRRTQPFSDRTVHAGEPTGGIRAFQLYPGPASDSEVGKPRSHSDFNILKNMRVYLNRASQVALAVKNSPTNTGDIRDMGSIPGSGRSPGGGPATHSSILAWRIPWTEEPGGLQSIVMQSDKK